MAKAIGIAILAWVTSGIVFSALLSSSTDEYGGKMVTRAVFIISTLISIGIFLIII